MKKTIVEEVFSKKINREVQVGEIVEIEPDWVLSHDNAALVIQQFRELGAHSVWNPSKIVIVLDHRVPAESIKTANAHKTIREFVKEQNILHFYDIGEGICHQVMIEKGHAGPGQVILGTDSHTISYGCVSAFSAGIGATEMAGIWAMGKTWLKVPDSIRIMVHGHFRPGVYAKDLILFIIGMLKSDGAEYKSVEFGGETVSQLGISERFTLCNMSMEMGAKCAFISTETMEFSPSLYEQILEIYADDIVPQIACPHQVDNVVPVEQVAGKKIHQALLGSCTNGRFDDFKIAASILRNRRIHPEVRCIAIPASKSIYQEMLKTGILETLLNAGVVVCNPGCGPCLGAHQGILGDGEVCISTTNRNFKGRMGSLQSQVYLASPATVATSALYGQITVPEKFIKSRA